MSLRDLPNDHDIRHLHAALQFCNNFRVAVDIGAHRGIWTKVLCDKFDYVLAIEPSELAEHIDSRATVVRAACGWREKTVGLQQGTQNTGQTHCVPGDEVPVVTLNSFPLPHLDFLKVDVEGMEWDALVSGGSAIRRHKPVIVIEENGLCERYGIRPGAAGRLLERWGATLVKRMNKDFIYTWPAL